jgi:hypothetical protein
MGTVLISNDLPLYCDFPISIFERKLCGHFRKPTPSANPTTGLHISSQYWGYFPRTYTRYLGMPAFLRYSPDAWA